MSTAPQWRLELAQYRRRADALRHATADKEIRSRSTLAQRKAIAHALDAGRRELRWGYKWIEPR
jgi:hypothetical protein